MKGVWVAYYPDWSGFTIHADEIDALRAAVTGSMSVVFVAFGEDPRKVANVKAYPNSGDGS